MIVCKANDKEDISDIFDDRWDITTSNKKYYEIIHSSVWLKYKIGSKNFIFSYYKWNRYIRNQGLYPLDWYIMFGVNNESFEITLKENGNMVSVFTIREKYTLAQLC